MAAISDQEPGPRKAVKVVQGDLLDQDVDVIVNAWNRNIIPGGFCSRKACPGQSSGVAAPALSRNSPSTARSHWAGQF